MPRVKYTYDGVTGIETTVNFSDAEEREQDAIDAQNQATVEMSVPNDTRVQELENPDV